MSRFEGAPDLIGADGKPIEHGDTVYELGKVKPIIVGFVDYVDRRVSGYTRDTGARVYHLKPESITHHKPRDSWESIWATFDFIIEKQGEGVPMFGTTRELCDRIQAMLSDVETDRTCLMEQVGGYFAVRCSACGYVEDANLDTAEGGTPVYAGKYCPECGRKVVRDADRRRAPRGGAQASSWC